MTVEGKFVNSLIPPIGTRDYMPQVYKIRRAIVIPLALSCLFLVVLLLRAWLFPSLPGERVVLTAIFLGVGYLFLEVLARQASFGNDVLQIRKFMRNKEFGWEEITHLGSLVMGVKVYLLLTTTRGFYILSNNYERFPELLRRLVEKLSAERIGGEVSLLMANPPKNNQPVRSAWLMAAVIMVIMALRLFVF